MAAVEANVNGLELEKVISKVRTLFERDDFFYATIRKHADVEVISNRQMRIPLELRPGGSFQYFDADGGDLGRGGGPTWDKAVVSAVFLSENIEYTKLTQWSTNNDRKSVQNAVKRMTATALDELRRQIDSQLMQAGNGVIGTITVVATAAGVDTYTLDANFGSRLVRHGQTVQVFDATLVTYKGKGVITLNDADAGTIDVTPAIAGAVATDLIVTDGITAPLALPALYGVPYHHSNASTGTWLGFSRATTPEVRANRINAAGAALSLPLPRLAQVKIGNRLGRDHKFKSPEAWMHPAQMAAYEEIGQTMIVINKSSKDENFNPYFGQSQFAGARANLHYSWNKSRIDYIVPDLWGRAEILPVGFYKSDGRHIFEIRGASGGVATADIFYMVVGMQIFHKNPAAESYIDNLAIPAGY